MNRAGATDPWSVAFFFSRHRSQGSRRRRETADEVSGKRIPRTVQRDSFIFCTAWGMMG